MSRSATGMLGIAARIAAVLAVGVLLVALGNGRAALWTPDERLLRRRAGVRAANNGAAR